MPFFRSEQYDASINEEPLVAVLFRRSAKLARSSDGKWRRNVHNLVIGLNRENVNVILAGEVITLPAGYLEGLNAESDVVLIFGETNAEIEQCFPPAFVGLTSLPSNSLVPELHVAPRVVRVRHLDTHAELHQIVSKIAQGLVNLSAIA